MSDRIRKLYFGDNLEIMREFIADESVDLVYLDPPFNSNQTYNVLFKSDDSRPSRAQMEAFDDTWHWTSDTQAEYERLITGSVYDVPPVVSKAIDAFRILLGQNDVMAYIVMMTPRLLEMYRVLKPSGSMYLHCDPTTGHYLKVICDQIFGPENFRNEIIWKRTSAHSDSKQGRRAYGSIHDLLLFYVKGEDAAWNPYFTPYDQDYLDSDYRHVSEDGRYYKEGDLTAAKPGGDTQYAWNVKRMPGERWVADLDEGYKQPVEGWEYKSVKPYSGRYWAYSRDNMVEFAESGKLIHRSTGMPRLMLFADEMPGIGPQDLWLDIPPIGAKAAERLGFPTQKPQQLLERIIETSTAEGGVVLDPFCGCGTTVAAAEKLDRSWIGIDITYLAVALIEQRLQDHYPGIEYEEHGSPKGMAGAKALFELSPKNFEMWAVRQVGGRPNPKGGGDEGTDGIIRFYIDEKSAGWVTISVKGGATVNPSMVRDLIGTVEKDGTDQGLLITRTPPTQGMIETAAKAGFYTWPVNGQQFPKIQIITVEQLLEGKRPDLPPEHGTLAKALPIEDTGTQLKMT